MNKYIFASSNNHKVNEIKHALPELYLVSLKEIGYNNEIIESGLTLEENAKIKARTIFNEYKITCISDDTGLEVNCLNGRPGVYSARYAGGECDASKNIQKLLNEMLKYKDRSATFRTIICLKTIDKELLFEGSVSGSICKYVKSNGGFGYDPIFVPDGHKLAFSEMSLNEKNKCSHRAIALNKLHSYLMN